MRDIFAILNRDYSQSDAELRERLRRIHEARRELELFHENQNEIYRDEPFILVQICRVWNTFLRDWISGTNMSLFILDTTSRRSDN